MKKLIASLLLVNSIYAFAQKTDADYSPAQYKTNTCHSSFIKVKLEGNNTVATTRQYFKQNIANLKDYRTGLKLNCINESPGGFHYSFTQTFNGAEIYQSEIKVNVDHQNVIHSIFDNSENTSGWNLNTAATDASSLIVVRNDIPVLCKREITDKGKELLTANGEIVFERDMNSYVNQDSLVSGKVFLPDPLTSSQHVYGAPYFDNNDSTNVSLDAELKPVNFIATYTGTNFILENSFVRVRDFDLPTLAPVTSGNGQFYYNRSQSGFEDINAFYHINTIRDHIHLLGFNCADSLVDIDPHAVSGADNSYFSPISTPNRIYYGTGGVDDAEDADVCVHEYGHFVSDHAAPGSNVGQQRNSLDEGFGDYLAGSYSKSISTYNDDWMFNWDGHNEFWNGRVLNSSWVYPDDLTSSIYHNAQIWSPVLMCINATIGREATDSIILQAHYSYAQNMSMQDAAQLLMDADTLLTGGVYACPIYRCLFQHGLQPVNPFINCGVGIKEKENFAVKFLNGENSFSISNTGLQKIQLQIVNLTGQLIWTGDENQSVFNYNNSSLATGIYLVNVKVNGVEKTFKWSKLN